MWRTMESLPFLGRKGKVQYEGQEYANANGTPRLQYPAGKVNNTPVAPSLKATLERKVYRPGDMVVFTIDILNDELQARPGMVNDALANAILVDDLIVEVRGIEKLDPQWLITPKLPAGSKQRRGFSSTFTFNKDTLGLIFLRWRSAWNSAKHLHLLVIYHLKVAMNSIGQILVIDC